MCRAEIEVGIGVFVASRPLDLWRVAVVVVVVVVVWVCLPAVNVNDRVSAAGALLWGWHAPGVTGAARNEVAHTAELWSGPCSHGVLEGVSAWPVLHTSAWPGACCSVITAWVRAVMLRPGWTGEPFLCATYWSVLCVDRCSASLHHSDQWAATLRMQIVQRK